jgi:hypothetical protein
MKRSSVLWVLAFVITIASALYQRMTGPTYPASGKAVVGGTTLSYRLLRSNETDEDAPVKVSVDGDGVLGTVEWKRHNVAEAWNTIPMKDSARVLSAWLPRQPMAGKLDYHVLASKGGETLVLPAEGVVTIRFKGRVPLAILLIHIAAMFSAMMLSMRTGLEFFNPESRLRPLVLWTIGVLAFGGLVLGPIVQKYAFDAYWTGWPFGHDLTDNKTFLALLGWVVTFFMLKKAKRPAAWALGACILMFAVYMIPHSVLGSELDYNAQKTPPAVNTSTPQNP